MHTAPTAGWITCVYNQPDAYLYLYYYSGWLTVRDVIVLDLVYVYLVFYYVFLFFYWGVGALLITLVKKSASGFFYVTEIVYISTIIKT